MPDPNWYDKSIEMLIDDVNYCFRLVVIYFLFFKYRTSSLSFKQFAYISGFSENEFVNKLKDSEVKESFRPGQFSELLDDKANRISCFLSLSTEAMNKAGCVDSDCFAIGTTDILDIEKKVSYQAYHRAMQRLFVSKMIKHPFNSTEIEAIRIHLDSYLGFKRNISPLLLYVIQTQCLCYLGYPFFNWNLEYYLEAVYKSMISIYYCDEKSLPSLKACDFLQSTLESIGILVDNSFWKMVYNEKGTLFSLNDLITFFNK